jgi:hypothetical protein
MNQGGVMLVKIKSIVLITMISSPLFASDFGTYTDEAKIRLAKERVDAIVSKSQASRKDSDSSRDVASITPQDFAWASKYDELMKSDKSIDYLKEASEL